MGLVYGCVVLRLTGSAQVLRPAEVQTDDDGLGWVRPPSFCRLLLGTSEKYEPTVGLTARVESAC